jgi:glycosyltransferase involved in cell wall biosynthesis
MRICVMTERFPVVSETFVVDHAAGLRARGHDVTVVAVRSRQGAFRTLPRAAALRFAVGRGGFAARGFTTRLGVAQRVGAARPFDLVHAHFGPTATVAVAMRIAGVFDTPILCSFHGYDANVIARRWPGCYDGLIGQVAGVTVGSEFMRGVVADLGFSDISLWPQGVDTARIGVRASGRAGGDPFHVVTVARLVEFKGIDVSLRAVAAARSRIPEMLYTVVGDGERRDELCALAGDLGVDDIVTFAGARPHDEALAALATADAFLLTGRVDREGHREGQGVAVLEASASGVPVIASRCGGLPEVVVDGVSGLLVEPEDPGAAADALVRVAADPGFAARLGAGGRAHVEQCYSRERSLDLVEELYAAL